MFRFLQKLLKNNAVNVKSTPIYEDIIRIELRFCKEENENRELV